MTKLTFETKRPKMTNDEAAKFIKQQINEALDGIIGKIINQSSEEIKENLKQLVKKFAEDNGAQFVSVEQDREDPSRYIFTVLVPKWLESQFPSDVWKEVVQDKDKHR